MKNKNGQSVLVFTCTQCKRVQQTDFRHYPLCKKCNVSNQRIAKRNKNGHCEENIIEKSKKRGRKPTAYAKYENLCKRVYDLKTKERLSNNKISKIFNSEGLKTSNGFDWNTSSVEHLYNLYKKNNSQS